MNREFESLLKKYYTARIDIKNNGKQNNIIILNNSDDESTVSQPEWFNDSKGMGTIIHSLKGELNLKIKCVNEGKLVIHLLGPDIKDKNGKRFPIYIDYTNFSINNNPILKSNKLTCHNQPHIFSKDVYDEEIIDIHIQWMPFNHSSELNEDNSQDLVQDLKDKLSLREKQLKSLPQLSTTTLGFPALDGKLIYRNLFRTSNGILDDLNGILEHEWLSKFIKNKFPNEDFKINIFGVAYAHDNLKSPMEGKKVFFPKGEDLEYRFLEMKYYFDKYALDYVDLSLGTDIIDHPKYLRLPFWLTNLFPPESTEEDIEKKIESLNSAKYEKSKDIAAIASHDTFGTRTLIDNDINNLINVSYAGKWKNNTSELVDKYNNNKINYLKQFKFNLCAENLLNDAYVTEKIFHAIMCDCIPLYAGGGNYLEPKILNPDAIIRWDGEKIYSTKPNILKNARLGFYTYAPVKWEADEEMNSDSIELFKNLITDKKTYDEFKDQDRVLSSSTKYILRIFSDLEKHFERLIYYD